MLKVSATNFQFTCFLRLDHLKDPRLLVLGSRRPVAQVAEDGVAHFLQTPVLPEAKEFEVKVVCKQKGHILTLFASGTGVELLTCPYFSVSVMQNWAGMPPPSNLPST